MKHISPDRKATCAVKAAGLARDDSTLMVLNRYFSKITDIELGAWEGQMSMEAESPLRYHLDWTGRTQGTNGLTPVNGANGSVSRSWRENTCA